jgi:hypothetical protein
MVYSKIFIYTSKSTKGRNMGEFYGTISGITIECLRVNFG